jgi:hypothetical protein
VTADVVLPALHRFSTGKLDTFTMYAFYVPVKVSPFVKGIWRPVAPWDTASKRGMRSHVMTVAPSVIWSIEDPHLDILEGSF